MGVQGERGSSRFGLLKNLRYALLAHRVGQSSFSEIMLIENLSLHLPSFHRNFKSLLD